MSDKRWRPVKKWQGFGNWPKAEQRLRPVDRAIKPLCVEIDEKLLRLMREFEARARFECSLFGYQMERVFFSSGSRLICVRCGEIEGEVAR